MADDMKRNNGFIPGIKPGPDTSDFISNVMDWITLPGSILLMIAILLNNDVWCKSELCSFGGTSLIIVA